MSETLTPDVPGRGAWRRTGGLLPAKPGQTGEYGFYRKAALGEVWIGSPWVLGADRSHTARVVNLGVRAIQRLAGLAGRDVDGWFGPKTGEYVTAAQHALGAVADGIVGPNTMRAFLLHRIETEAMRWNVPVEILGGLLVFESGLDPAAVGTNGWDTGVAQINLSVHDDDVTLDQALDPAYSIEWTAGNLITAYSRYLGNTHGADPWDVAIAYHNSPARAAEWARDGEPPVVAGRVIQIEEYVAEVRAAW